MEQPPFQWPEHDAEAPPRCLSCGYVLDGLSEARCPECARPFDVRNPRSYSTKPPFLAWTYWFPGLMLAIVGSLLGSVWLIQMGNWGWSLWFAVPFAGGSLIGYGVRSRWFVLVLLGITLMLSICTGMMMLNIAGIFCGMALAGILLGPIFVGTVLGASLRLILKHSRFSQRSHLPTFLFLLLPLVCGVIEGPPRNHLPPESIATSIIVPAPVDACWNAIMFYEEVTHPPPLILRIGLAHPLAARGDCSAVGDVKTCIYNKGVITKQVTRIEPGRLLAFDVIEQRIGYERDLRLVDGSFAFQAVDDTHTRITLTTRYEPLLRPRWCWRPFERFAIQTLHGHVIEGMRLKAAQADPQTAALTGEPHAHLDR